MFTDYLNNPIAVGDVIIYPQSQGSSSAHIQAGRVIAIDEIIKDSINGDVYLHSKRHQRGSYSGLRYPTFTVPDPSYDVRQPYGKNNRPWKQEDDPSKAYQLKIQKIKRDLQTGDWKEEGKPVTIRNVDRATVITPLGDFS